MADDELHDPISPSGLYASAAATTPERRNRRRKQAVVGAAGAAALLAGATFAASQFLNAEQPEMPAPAALAPQTTVPVDEPEPEPVDSRVPTPTSKSTVPAAPVEASPAPPSPSPSVTAETMAGTETPEQSRGDVTVLSNGPVNERTELLGTGTIRIVTAQRDLTGERDMLLAADDGQAVGGGVHCTSKVRMSTGTDTGEKPTLLLCWRTSKARSVVTMAVVPTGKPPTASSVDIIGKEWARLG
ncbi:hypothetical protein [Actinoplanes rectilineatus]|uniref:hypothetical protein n=1 Tax=Actinoplanes rectilineatus TaxID=113571 RepID=UPI0005F2E13C|nr:hypothetical protein [Actinoplanes rectilineatus]